MAEEFKNPGSSHRTISIDTPAGAACWELSPQKIKEHYLELLAGLLVHCFVDDIDYKAAMRNISLDVDESEDLSTFRTSISEVINDRAKEEAHISFLQKLIGSLVCRPENIPRLQEVENLLETDLKNAGIDFTPSATIHAKAKLLSQHRAWVHLPRQTRSLWKEFCVRIYKLRNCSLDNLVIDMVYLPYDIDFSLFLARLQDMTSFQRPNGGFTLEEGPWQYRLSSPGQNAKEWHLLADENSFMKMVGSVKSGDGQVNLCHDILLKEINRHVEEKEREQESWDRADEDLYDEQGDRFFDGRYLEYLATLP